ncbi:hypothetical protein [Streptomyces goshikiensis]|uniref:hypothetical protein n=1 Tax=Streptomyces goshikiensis TaxID=1942 RepID=UPI0036ACD4D9
MRDRGQQPPALASPAAGRSLPAARGRGVVGRLLAALIESTEAAGIRLERRSPRIS